MAKKVDLVATLTTAIDTGSSRSEGTVSGTLDMYRDLIAEHVEGATQELVEGIADFNLSYAAAAGLVVGQHLRDNEDVPMADGHFPIVGGNIEQAVYRETEINGEMQKFYMTSMYSIVASGEDNVMDHAINTVASYAPEEDDA